MKKFNFYKLRFGFLVLLICALASGRTMALELSQVPLFVSAGVAPNVMFIMDDSGSMHWETMPEEYTFYVRDVITGATGWNDGTYFMFPAPSGVYGSASMMRNNVVRFSGNYAAFFRSEHNTVYYNPSVTYRPWVRADGSEFPQANPGAAYYNPTNLGAGSLDLTTNRTQRANWLRDSNGTYTDNTQETFYPATYYYYTGGDRFSETSYTKVEIKSSTATYVGHGRENRSDCQDAANARCTYAEEIQNFANWFQFSRSRILAARGGIGRAFVEQDEGLRVGYGAINAGSSTVDGRSQGTVITGVRPFTGAAKESFYDNLYNRAIPNQTTPLRRALDDAGQYFSRTDPRSPWAPNPALNNSGPPLECRQSYTVLMTDGYWTDSSAAAAGTAAARRNVDSEEGSTITAPDGREFKYVPAPPFSSPHSDTLADVAMYYWKRDLQPDMPNKVPRTATNPAFWQHMVTYGVGLGVEGSIDPSDAFRAMREGTAIPGGWPNPHGEANRAAKIDDLLHAAVNSRGGFFSAADPETFATELSGVLQSIVERRDSSSSSIAANSTRLDTDTLIYQASFNSNDWRGDLEAFRLNQSGELASTPRWSAAQLLDAMSDGQLDSRRIFTSHNGAIMPFRWNELSAVPAIRNILDGEDGAGAARVAYLRGARGQEISAGGAFRDRGSRLGDIVNSDPAFTGRESFGYQFLQGEEGEDYFDYLQVKRNRAPMIYVGANDGMLHGFHAETGEEILAYIPASVLPQLPELTDPEYGHKFYVDGSPVVTDVYRTMPSGEKQWRTVLIGTLGAGGNAIFALDVTDPYEPELVWEVNAADHPELGRGINDASLVRVMGGTRQNPVPRWMVVAGNGYGSQGHRARLLMIDFDTGNLSSIAVGAGSAAQPNGLAAPVAISSSGGRTADTIYAGDLHGSLWKFSQDRDHNWQVALQQGSTDRPLFTGQLDRPITAKPAVSRNSDGEIMVFFGTGKYLETSDSDPVNQTRVQRAYGVIDSNTRLTDTNLVRQRIIYENVDNRSGRRVRVVSDDPLGNSHHGWYMDLVPPNNISQGERIVARPVLRADTVVFVTLIPSSNPCDAGGTSWLMALAKDNGGRIDEGVFDLNDDGEINEDDFVYYNGEWLPISALQSESGILTPPNIQSGQGGVDVGLSQGSEGLEQFRIRGDGSNIGRQSWRQIR